MTQHVLDGLLEDCIAALDSLFVAGCAVATAVGIRAGDDKKVITRDELSEALSAVKLDPGAAGFFMNQLGNWFGWDNTATELELIGMTFMGTVNSKMDSGDLRYAYLTNSVTTPLAHKMERSALDAMMDATEAAVNIPFPAEQVRNLIIAIENVRQELHLMMSKAHTRYQSEKA